MYIKINNGIIEKYPYSPQQLILDNPNTSFPEKFHQSILENFSVYPVLKINKPVYDYTKQTVTEGTPVFENGNWKQTWIISNNTPEEIDQRLEEQKLIMRQYRNSFLFLSDWTQMPDSPLDTEKKEAWRDYRQKLRDISEQPEFPWAISWPTCPDSKQSFFNYFTRPLF